MKKYLLTKIVGVVFMLSIYTGFISCENDNSPGADLILSATEVEIGKEEAFTVDVKESNGKFRIDIEDPKIVNATILGNTITFRAVSSGSTTAVVTDEAKLSVTISIKVTGDTDDEDEGEETEELSDIYYSYEQASQEVLNVYVKVGDETYAWFKVAHEVNTNHFKDLWRVKDSYICSFTDNQMEVLYPILTAGENEFVWYSAREDVQEATGGYHGNERIDIDPYGGIQFFADDLPIDLSSYIPLTPASTFYYIQHSTMHETGTGALITSPGYIEVPGNPIECYHEKRTVFNNGGYDTYNKLTWAKNNTPVLHSYFGLFCVTPDVSKIGYNESGAQVEFNDDGGMKLTSNGTKITMYNPDLKISVTCDSKVIKPTGYATTTMIWDRNVYHKYYNRIGGGGVILQTTEGEEWEFEASLHFSKLD